MILKMDVGKLELRSDSGSFIRTIVTGKVIDADLSSDEKMVLITLVDGKVELRSIKGSFIRTITTNKFKRARFQGNDVALTLETGKIEIRSITGSYIRTI
jgi:hypothetical protein